MGPKRCRRTSASSLLVQLGPIEVVRTLLLRAGILGRRFLPGLVRPQNLRRRGVTHLIIRFLLLSKCLFLDRRLPRRVKCAYNPATNLLAETASHLHLLESILLYLQRIRLTGWLGADLLHHFFIFDFIRILGDVFLR